MTQMPARIGSYRVVREIGRGAMGVVYLARDERLDRDVAIKALPEELAVDPDRLARFEYEGKALAQLSHPNVAGIYGLEESDGRKFLLLEYVEGDTLGDRLEAGPIPTMEALELAVGIAAGLEAAHDVGVIHRDLKPDNIKITPDGEVKVLDFGLAKSSTAGSSTNLADAPTLASPRSLTIAGAIMGTPAYMSPEQARGRSVDKRSDIWSFGVVLYECLTGRSPFVGETASDSIGAILHKEVDFDQLPPGTPALLRRLLGRCLQRDKAHRLRDIGDVRLELAALASGESFADLAPPDAPAVRGRRGVLLGAGAVIIATVITALAVRALMPPVLQTTAHLALPQPRDRPIYSLNSSLNFAITRDGRRVVYVANIRRADDRAESVLVVWQRDKADVTTLTDLQGVATDPFFSPDGEWIGYTLEDDLMRISIDGGVPIRICRISELPGDVRGAVWRSGGAIVLGTANGGLYIVPSSGGVPQPLTTLAEGESAHCWPDSVPGSDGVLHTIQRESGADVAVFAPGASRSQTLVGNATFGRYVAPGYLLYATRQQLWADTFDRVELSIGNRPIALDERVRHSPWSGLSEFTIAQDGTFVYGGPISVPTGRTLVWLNREGEETPTGFPAGPYFHFALSPSGAQIAVEFDHGTGVSEVWIGETAGEDLRRYSADFAALPIWTSDSRELIVLTDSASLLRRLSADGTGPVGDMEIRGIPRGTSPDGRIILARGSHSDWDLWLTTLDGVVEPLLVEPGINLHCAFSRDGKWMSFTGGQGIHPELYIAPYPNLRNTRIRIPGATGSRPIWNHDGTELYFMRGNDLMVVPITTNPELSFGTPRLVRPNIRISGPLSATYAPMPDDERILLMKEDPSFVAGRDIHVVVNWIEVLKAKMNE